MPSPRRQTVLDFVRANPGCSHMTPGANFSAARMAALHRLLDAGRVRYQWAECADTQGRTAHTWIYFAADAPKEV